jgi:hypothetical protein
MVSKFVSLNFLEPSGLTRAIIGLLYLLLPERSLYGSTHRMPGWVGTRAVLDVAIKKNASEINRNPS